MTVMMATAFGIKIPPPTPVNALAATNAIWLSQKAFTREKSVKMAPPIRSVVWWP